MKIEPKCLSIHRTKQLMFSSYGYFLPCCECDTTVGKDEFTDRGFFNEEFHISNLNNPEDIKEVLNSNDWQSFYKGLIDDPENAPTVCKEFCKEGWDK
tara:strand:+ start:271 stop:564 length:294 start_codon:yes stop_codon:yes gene_type:complete